MSDQIKAAKISGSAAIAAALITALVGLFGSYLLGSRGKQAVKEDKADLQDQVETLSEENSTLSKRLELLESQIENLKNTQDNLPPPPDTPPPEPTTISDIFTRETAAVQSLKELKFNLKGCVRKPPNIECYLTVKNQGPSYERSVCARYCGTMLVDQDGREILASRVRIANKEENSYLTFNFRNNLAVKNTFVFEGVAASTTEIEVLEIRFGLRGDTSISFNNVPLFES